MTDREMLVLAAKAAGIKTSAAEHRGGLIEIHSESEYAATGSVWNPSTADGDALRLAALLGMDFKFFIYDSELQASCISMGALGHRPAGDYFEFSTKYESHEVGTTAPYRRAAVGLAAAIGEQMP